MFFRTEEHFSVEAIQLYGANVASFQLASSGQRFHIVECYLELDGASTIEDIVPATSQRPRGATMLMVRYFNTNLAAPEGGRGTRRLRRIWPRQAWNI